MATAPHPDPHPDPQPPAPIAARLAANRKTLSSAPCCDPKLAALVAEAPAFSHVCTPAERAALAELAAATGAALTPASPREIRRMIGKLALGFPATKASDLEAEARLELYAEGLADLPADILGGACARALRECRFFPSVSEIRERCGMLAVRRWELSRIRTLIATHDRDWRPAGAPMTEMQRARLAALAGWRNAA